jgi:hypothetical protein
MRKPTIVVTLTLLVVTSTAAGTVPVIDFASSNETPLVDAGLDQEVPKGTTVLLDGTGSRDPDGDTERYNWSIRTPSNETITPECTDCARTEFEPAELGRYRVTLTVTDDDGATSSDTLFVDVSPGSEPSITLSGPQQLIAGDTATYTADLDAGAASLEHVVWAMDGTVIANHSLSPEQDGDVATKRFPTAGDRTVTATVYDADGQSSTDSIAVTVRSETESPDPPGSSNPPNSSLADQYSPTVTGDALITGTKPLRGQYGIQLEAAASEVTSVEWRDVGGSISTGGSLTRTWEPGNHTLYAVVSYNDGSSNVATFDDGSTTVVADPRPNASFGLLNRYAAISGTVTGLDEYGNLDDLYVEVDGETVATSDSSLRDRYQLDDGRRQTLQFSHEDFVPGERHSVTVVAVDERGQTAEVTRNIVPVKEPEIVRSEFVNTPVDSYHERLDPSRYAAHHILEIDLNGVDRENVSIRLKEGNGVTGVNTENYSRLEKDTKDDMVVVQTFWRGPRPGTYEIDSEYEVNGNNIAWWEEKTDQFEITPSKPELRLDVLNDGTKDYITREHGILVDASDSFDPDGTELKYIWKHGATPTKPDNTTAKFRAYERAASIVEDEYELRTKRNSDFLSYFVPDIEEKTVITDGPSFPNETVRVRVATEAYHLSKPTYYDDLSLGLTVQNSKGDVREWYRIEAPNSGHSDATEDAYRRVGIVEIPASELVSSTPTISVYNEDNERKTSKVDYPDVDVLVKDGNYWTNATVRNITYTIEKPDIHEVTARSEEARDNYIEDGYSVDSRQNETEYVLEKRIKVQDAEYERKTETFESETMRNMFVKSRPDWFRDGTTQKEVTKTETNTRWYDANTATAKTEWHDSKLENGEHTGKTRETVVDPARYQIEKEYRYDYEVEKTGTRTVTRTRRVTVPRTGTRTTTTCSLKFGCTTTTETYTYYTTQSYSYTTTETYTYTVTRTNTYWSTAKFDPSHEFTGKRRTIQIESATYEAQYEIKTENQYTETVTHYTAGYDEVVQPTQYEWQKAQSTNDSMLARKHTASNEDWRIGESVTTTSWVLIKTDSTVREKVTQYENESRVVVTSATIEGDIVERYINPETGNKVTKEVREQEKQYTSNDAKSREEIIVEIEAMDSQDDECKLKWTCPE